MRKSRQRTKARARKPQPSRGELRRTIDELTANLADAQRRADEATRNLVTPSPQVTVAAPRVTFVHYADRSYMHVNGGLERAYELGEIVVVQRAVEAIEATGAVKIAEQDLRHLTVNR